MQPYYQDDYVTLYHSPIESALDIIPSGSVLLTDPPYGIGDRMKGGTWGAAAKYADFRRWDVAPPITLLAALLDSTTEAIIWGGNYFALPPSRCWLVWDKRNAVATMSDVELAWTNLDRPSKRFSWPVGIHASGHPTEKPLSLIAWALGFLGDGIIVDPYAGSGTTLRAAKDLGRKVIGVEICEAYCELIAKRMAQEPLLLGV